MYEPSPRVATTKLSGAASFAPSAAPNPHPSPPAGPSAKNVPGFSRAQWSGRSGYSLMMMASLPTVSPMTRDRYSGEIVVPAVESFANCAPRVRHLQTWLDGARERIERLRRAGLQSKVAREAAHRVPHIERILADMRHAAATGWMLQMRNPGHVGFERDDKVGIGKQGARLESEMHGMVRRQAHRARAMRDDRNGAALGETLKLVDSFCRQGRRYDQRALGGSDPFGQH